MRISNLMIAIYVLIYLAYSTTIIYLYLHTAEASIKVAVTLISNLICRGLVLSVKIVYVVCGKSGGVSKLILSCQPIRSLENGGKYGKET